MTISLLRNDAGLIPGNEFKPFFGRFNGGSSLLTIEKETGQSDGAVHTQFINVSYFS
jgi:hypothetical protein